MNEIAQELQHGDTRNMIRRHMMQFEHVNYNRLPIYVATQEALVKDDLSWVGYADYLVEIFSNSTCPVKRAKEGIALMQTLKKAQSFMNEGKSLLKENKKKASTEATENTTA